ncbi:MAG: protein kinase [Spartobacteria bacterium]
MPALQKNISSCEQCGAPLKFRTTNLGCFNCLLLGGFNDTEIASRRFQHYEICLGQGDGGLDELGRGSMGITYHARDIKLGSPVALKVIKAEYSADPETRERFLREARSAAQLRHPNVASVFHFGETEAGECFYAMELVEGETLEALVRRAGPLPVIGALEVALQVARALCAAETHGLVHRDLKPGNLMVVANDSGEADALVVKVIDFGLARSIAAGPEIPGQARAGFSGTPGFASPEQFGGGEVDTRSDIYSLGATLWYLLCGRPPFSEWAPRELRDQSPPLEHLAAAHLPASVTDLLRIMLAVDPPGRPQSARELLSALQRCHKIVEATPRRRRQRGMLALTLGLLIISTIGLTNYFHDRPTAPASAATAPSALQPEKSIAVLPFEDLSNDKANAYFADGVQGEILTALANIAELKVISRTSVMHYQSSTRRNLREIGTDLRVANIVEGSVQRSGDRVRVAARLIDARTDIQLWGNTYDRELTDIFSVERDVAKAIAGSMQAKLTAPEQRALETEPTRNAAAYDAYLRARQLETGPNTLLRDFKIAEQLYERAVSLDPGFALAHARLAQTNAEIFHFHERTEPWKTRAKTEAEEALRLQPNLAEGHHALGLYFYWLENDYEHALKEFEHAIRLAPGGTESPFLVAAIRRRQGRWHETLVAYNRLADLDPHDPNIMRNLVYTNTALRDWPTAAQAAKRWRAIASDSVIAKIQDAYVDFWWHGSTARLKSELATIPAGVDPDGVVTAARWDVAMINRDYAAAREVLRACPRDELSYLKLQPTPKSFLLGALALARGDPTAAQEAFEMARTRLEDAVQEAPTNAERHANLGLLYAFLGRKQEAIWEALRAVELKPESQDALDGTVMNCYLALIYTRVGESDLAFPLIARLLRTSGAVDSADYSLTTSDLKFRWEWDPLRNDPRFEKIVASFAPKKRR